MNEMKAQYQEWEEEHFFDDTAVKDDESEAYTSVINDDELTSKPKPVFDFGSALQRTQVSKKKGKTSRRYKQPICSDRLSNIPVMKENKRESEMEETVEPKLDKDLVGDFIDSKYQPFEHLLAKEAGLHFSQLSRTTLRASLPVACKKSDIVVLAMWNVGTDGTFTAGLVPVVNCSENDTCRLLLVCQEIQHTLMEEFQGRIMTSLDACDQKQLFQKMTEFMIEKQPDVEGLLLAKLGESQGHRRKHTMKHALEKSTTCLDIQFGTNAVDIYAFADEVDRTNVKCHSTTEQLETFNNVTNTCIICFDDLEENGVGLSACDHQACFECWRGLMKSAKASGDVLLNCPAFKCRQQTLNKRDCAHLLFADGAMFQEDIHELLEKANCLLDLMRFRMEDYVIAKKMQHCKTAGCCGIFNINDNNDISLHSSKGTDICLCHCGASICSNCGKNSHVGLQCDQFREIEREIENGTMFSEALSNSWIEKNTSPCPKCSFRIRKNGGCNHIRCGNCSYYFCWMCGGDGESCGSFMCKGRGISTYSTNTDSHSFVDRHAIPSKLEMLKQYTDAQSMLNQVLRGKGMSSNSTRNLETQILQMLVWTISLCLWKQNYSSPSLSSMRTCIQQLEAALDTLSAEGEDLTPSDLKNLISPFQRTIPRGTQKGISTQAKRSIALEKERDDLHKYEPPQIISMATLESIDPKVFNARCAILFGKTFQQMVPCRRDKKSKSVPTLQTNYLNKKKKRIKPSWTKTRDTEDDYEESYSSDEEQPKIIKWKGKNKINARRQIAVRLSI